MTAEVRIKHITREYFTCGLCKDIARYPLECRICEHIFCYSCLQRFFQLWQKLECPNECDCFVFEKAGNAFEKIMKELTVKCKFTGCCVEESLEKIGSHELSCRAGRRMLSIEVDEEIVKRDAFWVKVLNQIVTPRDQGSNLVAGSLSCRVAQSFKF